ncbi:MAG TPA: peptide chain release factor N(5)-glutamine methyltransferase [Syntrophomonadaceae bacterium]|nr:peptide chain release factor N(5)-glutamine methyltransferase [Syntrophomonadaceae bacterium]
MQAEWTIKSLLEWTTQYFHQNDIPQARLEAEVLLARVLHVDRVYLYVHYQQPVDKRERETFKEYIQRRRAGEPSAYITGVREFMSLEFQVSRHVLIPRPETELLVETALLMVGNKEDVRVCDVGTGSGAVAVSMAYYCPGARVWAGDVSQAALDIARGNAERHDVRVEFRCGDLLSPFQGEEPFDLILANLPYIPQEEYADLPVGVKDYEPSQALLASGDGLDLYRRLLPQALNGLKDQGCILMEIGCRQGVNAMDLMAGWDNVELIQDLAGRDRLVAARKRER